MNKTLLTILFIAASLFISNTAKAGVIVRPTMNIGLVGYWGLALDIVFGFAIIKTLTPPVPSSDRAGFYIYE